MPKIGVPVSREQALDRYAEITDELNGLRAELSTAFISERNAKSNTWMAYMQNSTTERDRYSTHAALSYSDEISGIRSLIDSLLDERQYLDRMLSYGWA